MLVFDNVVSGWRAGTYNHSFSCMMYLIQIVNHSDTKLKNTLVLPTTNLQPLGTLFSLTSEAILLWSGSVYHARPITQICGDYFVAFLWHLCYMYDVWLWSECLLDVCRMFAIKILC